MQVNPENVEPSIRVMNGQVEDFYFSEDVAMRTPIMLRYDALILLILALISIVLVQQPVQASPTKSSKKQTKISQVLRHDQFWIILISGFLVMIGRGYFIAVYKIYGTTQGHDDIFLSLTGFVSNLFNGPSRILFSWTVDIYGFKKTALILYGCSTTLYASIHFVSHIKWCYMIWLSLLMFFNGATISIYASACGWLYGSKLGGKVFSIITGVLGLSGVLMGLLQRFVLAEIGYLYMFVIIVCATIAAVLVVLFFFKSSKYYENPTLTESFIK